MVHADFADQIERSCNLAPLRSRRTPSVQKGRRATAYVIGLTQAEDLWKAADAIEPLASPILRYYALMQACRALAAASELPNQQWEPGKSHGLTLEVTRPSDGSRLEFSNVRVAPNGDGMLQTLAAALGSPLITEPTRLDEILACLWRSRYEDPPAPASPLHPRRPLYVGVSFGDVYGPTRAVIHEALLHADPGLRTDPTRLDEFVSGYPGLSTVKSFERKWEGDHDELALYFKRGGDWSTAQEWRSVADIIDSETKPGWGSYYPVVFLPALHGSIETAHPLITWYLALYAFSMLARYYGDLWRQRLDINTDPDAVGLIGLVDDASLLAMGFVENAIRSFLRKTRT